MTYQFKCNKCNKGFTIVLQGFINPVYKPDCPDCKNNYNVVKVFTVPQIIFKGDDWAGKKG